MRRSTIFALLTAATIAIGGVAVLPAHAQLDTGLSAVGENVNLPDTDPRVIAARIINIGLGILGIIFVALILYAGFLYMTSGGDPTKTQTALRYIRNAVIGLIIILSAWAITRFVIDRLLDATGGTGTVTGDGGGGGGGGLGGGGGSQPFSIVSITPTGSVSTRKVIVKIVFNKPVSETSAMEPGAILVETLGGIAAGGDVVVDGRVVRFTSGTPCPAPNADRRCLQENTDYRVRVSNTLQATTGQRIACGGFSPSCDAAFRTGTSVDVTPPRVSMTYPLSGQAVSADALVDVDASISDETGVAYASFSDGATVIGESAPIGNTPVTFNARVSWDTAGLAPGSQHTLTATGYDVDSGVGTSAPVNVIIRAAHCFNGVQDQGETGLDCGGAVGTPDACGACSGSSCTVDNQCASGVCTNNVCVEQPIITSVTPSDGAVGSYITLRGVNFGTSGRVTFMGSAGSPGVDALSPQACTAAGTSAWSPTQAVIEVPSGAQNGPLRLTNGGSNLSDATNADPGPGLPDFLVNNTLRPGICAVVPSQGTPGQSFRLIGAGFGNVASPILFGDRVLTSSAWSDQEAQALIPNITAGTYPVSVQTTAGTSNEVGVRVLSPFLSSGPPQIGAIEPASGPVGTYVTLTGTNFGTAVGQVLFRETATGREALGDTRFPDACKASFWNTNSVVVKVPPSFTTGGTGAVVPGAYTVRLVTATAGAPTSNEVPFTVNTDPLRPGICAVTPSVAPVGTSVTIAGEHFTGGPGTVTFFQNRNGSATPWTDAQIASVIPAGALTGPVTVTPASNGRTSNGYLVQVGNCNDTPGICQTGQECCGDGSCRASGQCVAAADRAMFAWRTSTGVIPRAPRVVEECRAGAIPSPAPWTNRPGGDTACVNTSVTIRFTTQIEPTSVAPSARAIQVFECTAGGSDPCTEKNPITLAAGSPRLSAANATEDYVTLDPQSPFKAGTTYEVVLTTAVRGLGAAGTTMVEKSACGTGNAYCFRFKTRNDDTPCAIGGIQVAPHPYTATEQGPLSTDHVAVPLAQGDACAVLQCQTYDWNWSTSDGRASITNNQDLSRTPPLGACTQRATAQLETGDDPVKIQAATAGVTGSADLYVRFVPPRVERFGPKCDTACVNAAIWAVFTTALDPATVTVANVTVQRCANENCLDLDPPIPLSNGAIRLVPAVGSSDARLRQIDVFPTANGASLLLPGQFYKVTLRGGFQDGIRSISQVPLTGLNDPEGFAWTFRVQTGDAGACKVDHVSVTPAEKYETIVGARQGFTATPFSAPDACSEGGQELVPDANFVWTSSDTEVATLLQSGAIDTGAPVPAGCSGRCTLLGASGKAGETARCGDGVIETTNGAYCANGTTIFGQLCVLLPSGGHGGEECDDGNANTNDACNNACLWNPVASVVQGGTCGTGRLEMGEDCDFGRQCQGASLSSNTPDGTDCTLSQAEAQCLANSGICVPRQTRGCSATCRHLGSVAGNSVCGSASVGDGEDCDDGNAASGDGCSANCLNEGSSRNVVALCGNGTFEPGESCERQPNVAWPTPGCSPTTCLRTGVRPCATPNATLCCGDGNASEPGKDCDDGNAIEGDGCSATCLAEGASAAYAVPSFCSDGALGTGEQCESPGPAFTGDPTQPVAGGDGNVDPFQIATIIGRGVTDAEGKMSSRLTASLADQPKEGTAVYGLQCGFTDERSCSSDHASYALDTGLTSAGCCDARPRLATAFPPNAAGDTVAGRASAADPFPDGVCRNVLISGSFNQEMDTSSLQGNFLVAKRVTGDACPDGLRDVTDAMEEAPNGFRGFVQRAWKNLLSLFRISSASAERWCAGAVSGTLMTQSADEITSFFYTLDSALDARTEYRVRFMGDTSDPVNPLADNDKPENRKGVRSKLGVVAPPDTEDSGRLTWHFTTGDTICAITNVRVNDQTTAHPYLFVATQEHHPFVAYASSIVNGRTMPLSPTQQYAWEWQDWVFSNRNVIEIQPQTFATGETRVGAAMSRDAVSRDVSGVGYLSARVKVTADTANTPSMQGRVIQGTAHLTVNLCENPWPAIIEAPFRDEEGSPSLQGTPFANGPFYNFSMTYCRDAGAPGPNGDLPGLVINPSPPNAADAAQGVLRQYLFTFRENNLRQDAIGVRIAANPLHLSPSEWYRSKGFTGNPQTLTVDGYQAIRDGRTVYVSAVNTAGPDATGASTDLYSNIYLISYNENADAVTRQLYDALLSSLTFNTNVQFDVAGVCQDTAGSLVSGADALPVSCSADWECDTYGAGNRCANFKGKLQRDLVRLGDVQNMTRALETTKASGGSYPTLVTGSYLPGFSTSRWPSWTDTLKTALSGGSLPQDPVNRFNTCGRCNPGNTACASDTDCGQGGVCVAQNGFDPATCWNSNTKQFLCPAPAADNGTASRFYQYRSLQAGQRYALATEMEVPPPVSTDLTQRWWKPPLFTQIKECVVASASRGNFCETDADCRACPAGNCTGIPIPVGSCQAVGGQVQYANVCQGGAVMGLTGSCGDGVVDVDPSHLSCLGGTREGSVCTTSAECPGGSCAPNEICELKGSTATKQVSCTTTDNDAGQKQQRCLDCRRYADDTTQPGCFPVTQCGNGRVDVDETCDDGVLNGTYGKCGLTCTGYGAFCGDERISIGESCDLGSQNGLTCAVTGALVCTDLTRSCNITCSGPGPYCGNTIVDAGEACDGTTLTTSKAYCSSGPNLNAPCDTNAECGTGGICGGGRANACQPGKVCAGNTATTGQTCNVNADCETGGSCIGPVSFARTRSCNAPGTTSACQYAATWSDCLPSARCGNGLMESGEACDDGNSVNEDACTNTCTPNACGDGFLQKGVEECDNGTGNGVACTSSEYGATCTSCSTSCKFQLTQGGYCGDGIKNPGSPEQCDATDLGNGPGRAATVTCKALGYDYVKPNSTLSCTNSCQFGGCGYCGETVGTGIVEGVLLDTLFQQPVPNARVSLFYRGLQVNVANSDDTGYFRFDNLDTTTGCDQYRLVVDSYTDNPLTGTFDESKRGGYLPVSVGPFQPSNGSLVQAVTSAQKGVSIMRNNIQMSQINMVPRLAENEYVVQLWWDPSNTYGGRTYTGYTQVQTAFQTALVAGQQDAYYAQQERELHDLVIRLPFTYTPGTYGSCGLPTRPVAYNPAASTDVNGRNQAGTFTTTANGISWNTITGSTWQSGTSGADRNDAVVGMLGCTNKIRATLSKTCTGGTAPEGIAGCSVNGQCTSWQVEKYHFGSGSVCSATSAKEPTRQGPVDVLNGRAGAYLFCFHPEYPLNDARRLDAQCGNFLLPPQSAFISGAGGSYDILVSKYLLFQDPRTGLSSIRTWLRNRNATILVYDKNGVVDRWNFNDVEATVQQNAGWSPGDGRDWSLTLTEEQKAALSRADMLKVLYQQYANVVSPVWTPISIDTTGRKVDAWVSGAAGADYRYFSDLVNRENWLFNGTGGGWVWERTCRNTSFTDGSTYPVKDTTTNLPYKICNSGRNTRYGGSGTIPACDTNSQKACAGLTYTCATQVNASVRCLKVCNTDSDCATASGQSSFCGGHAPNCSSGQNPPMSRS